MATIRVLVPMYVTPLNPRKGPWKAVAALICSLSWTTIASAQLIWGVGGNGGSGTWDTTTANWWNGSANVAWTNGGAAIFSGVGGTVTSMFPGPDVTSITFDAPGYTIQNGWIDAAGPTLTITTNQPATISSTLSAQVIDGTLVKNGAATLTVAGTNFIDRVQVNSGEFLATAVASLFFSDVIIADAAGATVTLGQSSNFPGISSLSGGGASGGVLQPNNLPRTVTVGIRNSGTFRGIAQDNGSGKLGLEIFGPSNTTTLAGPNTYSGGTAIRSGKLVFSENGTALNSAFSISAGATLRLDNSTTAIPNRLSDSANLTLRSGLVELVGNGSTPIEEQLGTLEFSGAVSVNAVQPGSAATLLTFAGATRQGRATINFGGNGRTKWNGITNDSAGIVGGYATADDEWATVGADGRVEPLTNYVTDINVATPDDHIKIVGGGTTSLTASVVRETLNLQNNGATSGVLDVGAGKVLTLDDGGILSSGSGANRIQGGTLRAGASELVVTNRNALTIDSNIGQAVAGTGLTKSGTGTLTLTGTNSYSGSTVIDQGTLVVSSEANLGSGSEIRFSGGTLKPAGSFSSTKSLTHDDPYVGIIDTAGFDVAFSGPGSSLSKVGAGTLTLSNASPGSVTVSEGTLALTNPTSGNVTLDGGTLLASGSLSRLRMSSASTLDIGGINPAIFTADFTLDSVEPLTVRFDLGIGSQDLWKSTSPLSVTVPITVGSKLVLFDFQNLGGIVPGSEFKLMDATFPGLPMTPSIFGFAPSAIEAGWSGTFRVASSSDVYVTIATAPEPGSVALLAFGGMLLGGRFRFRLVKARS